MHYDPLKPRENAHRPEAGGDHVYNDDDELGVLQFSGWCPHIQLGTRYTLSTLLPMVEPFLQFALT
jgi:hypothetical protein